MKNKVAAGMAVVAVIALGALLLPRDEPMHVTPAVQYWIGEHCPITGKKYADANPENGEGNIPLQFEHEGMQYEAYVWDERAVDEFEQNRDKYVPQIIASSE